MIISKIASNQGQTSSGTPGKIENLPEKRVAGDNRAALPKGATTATGESKGGVSLGIKSQQVKTELNDLAGRIRLEDEALIKVNDFVERMKARLNKVVKNYPPFPSDSPERMELLKSFTALRKQIERMTFPTEDKHLPELPAVSEKSTDHEIKEVVTVFDDAAVAVNERRHSIASTIGEIAASLHVNTGEDTLLKKSGEVKKMLSTETAGMSGEQRINVLRQLAG